MTDDSATVESSEVIASLRRELSEAHLQIAILEARISQGNDAARLQQPWNAAPGRATTCRESTRPGTPPVEIRHVTELMTMARQAISGLRDEIRSGLGQRVTHAAVGGFMSTVTEKLNNIGQRVDHLEKT